MTTTFPKLTKYFYLPQHNSAGRLKIRKMPVVIVGVDSSGRPWQTARSVPFFFFLSPVTLKLRKCLLNHVLLKQTKMQEKSYCVRLL